MLKRFIFIILLGGLPHLCLANSKPATLAALPSSPAGNQFAAWLSAFNSMDRKIYSEFTTANSPALVKYIRDDFNFSVVLGGLKVERIIKSEDYKLTALVSESYSDLLSELSFEVEVKSPHLITSWEIRPAKRPEDLPLPILNETQLVLALNERLEKLSGEKRFSGVVLLAKKDRIVFRGAYGFADLAEKRLNTVDTRFDIASMGKMFTAVAILQLAEQGRLDLQAPVGKYLQDYPNANIAKNVTLHHLLTHTGGTGDIFVPEIEAKKGEINKLSDYIAVLGKREPEFAPGSQWDYSNYGFILLGRVIEKVSGEDYLDYVNKQIYAPAHMKQSGYLSGTSPSSISATGYTRHSDGNSWVAVSKGNMTNKISSAGGGLSTAQDLYAFVRALQKGKLLKSDSYELLTRGKVDMPNGKYAYGFKDQIRNRLRYVGHGGSAPGTNNELDIFPDSGYILIVLTNQDPPSGNRIADFIGNRLPRKN